MTEPVSRPPAILLADDDPYAQRALEALLTADGFRVITARDGQDALERIAETPPDLCVLDFDMPRLNGLETCRRIKNGHTTRLLPVILLTGLLPDQEKLLAIEAGCDDFLTKPFQRAELMGRIRSLLRIKSLTDDLEDAEAILMTLVRTIEAKDRYTLGHADRVSRYAMALGRSLGVGARDLETLRKGALLHDIGKLGIPDVILQKAGPLDAGEWDVMRQHPVIGCEICQRLKSLELVIPIIRSHHECLDGSGYPDGLTGGAIPPLVRIVNVVDIFDALTSSRSYKDAFTVERALHVMWEEVDRGWWDGTLVKSWEVLVRKGGVLGDSPQANGLTSPSR
jgi:putative two-component system response regulator